MPENGITAETHRHASLRSFKPGTDYWITVEAAPLSEQIKRHGKSPIIGEKREYFAHKLLGQKYTHGDAEGYYFEKDGILYRVHIFRIKGSRQPVDDILDSLEL